MIYLNELTILKKLINTYNEIDEQVNKQIDQLCSVQDDFQATIINIKNKIGFQIHPSLTIRALIFWNVMVNTQV